MSSLASLEVLQPLTQLLVMLCWENLHRKSLQRNTFYLCLLYSLATEFSMRANVQKPWILLKLCHFSNFINWVFTFHVIVFEAQFKELNFSFCVFVVNVNNTYTLFYIFTQNIEIELNWIGSSFTIYKSLISFPVFPLYEMNKIVSEWLTKILLERSKRFQSHNLFPNNYS